MTQNIHHINHIIGVDEVGRGPLAGPVTVAAVCMRKGESLRRFDGVRDSKRLSPDRRSFWFARIREARRGGLCEYRVSFVGPQIIDRVGIVKAVERALSRALSRLDVPPHRSFVLLDGGLHAPEEFIFQKTFIRGEEKRRLIAMASIVAKVARDRRMERYAKLFPEYEFDRHKGYGTKRHISAIKRHGLSPLHRRSFVSHFWRG